MIFIFSMLVSLLHLILKESPVLTWHEVKVEGESPSPRAGMTLTNLNDKLVLFGGSGQSALCYNDL